MPAALHARGLIRSLRGHLVTRSAPLATRRDRPMPHQGGRCMWATKDDDKPAARLSTLFTSFPAKRADRSRTSTFLFCSAYQARSHYLSPHQLYSSVQAMDTALFSAHFMRQTRTGSCRLVYIFQEKTHFAPFAYLLVFPNVNLRTSVR